MAVCYIVGAGCFYGTLSPGPKDLLIAADGGQAWLEQLGLRADFVVGDFDSLDRVPVREGVLRYPVMKDDTDTVLAVKLGLEQGFRRFCIYGGVGGRTDHTLANLQTLGFLAARGCVGCLVGDDECFTVVAHGAVGFAPGARGHLSVFAHGGKAEGVTLEGLQYSLTGATLTPDFPLGVSNAFTGVSARISVETGALLLCWQGGPELLLPGSETRGP